MFETISGDFKINISGSGSVVGVGASLRHARIQSGQNPAQHSQNKENWNERNIIFNKYH